MKGKLPLLEEVNGRASELKLQIIKLAQEYKPIPIELVTKYNDTYYELMNLFDKEKK